MSNARQLSERFRLASTESNALNEKAALKEKQNGAQVEKEILQLDEGKKIRYYHIKKIFKVDGKPSDKEILLFDVTKDSQSKINNPSLIYCGDVIKKICELYPNKKNLTVLLPTLQCRGFLKVPVLNGWFKKLVQKSHIVLTEMRLNDRQLVVHDSQRNFNLLLRKLAYLLHVELYPDKFLQILKELAEQGHIFTHDVQYYNKQNDNISCGIFNHQYVLSYLKHGTADQFQSITVQYGNQPDKQEKINDTIYLGEEGKEDYLAKFLNDWTTTEVFRAMQTPIWSANSFDEFDLEDLEQFELVNVPNTEEQLKKNAEIDSLIDSFVAIGDQKLFASPKLNSRELTPPMNLQSAVISNYKP